ncbi:MAG: radical SAM protein [Sideroxyarcus sp.]|nr:radical SAM protein [Sideroxyarcus sp.]
MSIPVTFSPHLSRKITEAAPETSPIVGNRVELQLLTTLTCNLKCTYCSLGVGDMVGSQGKVSYTVDVLDAFIKKHLSEHEVYVTFYGGEPTLNLSFIKEIMERYPTFRFQLQTNGTLLDNLPDSVLSNLSNILLSIDGGEAITDGFRGRGIYRQVVKNSRAVRDRLAGTFTARVTWSSEETTFEELDELADTFDYVYFQFVAGEGTYTPAAMEK